MSCKITGNQALSFKAEGVDLILAKVRCLLLRRLDPSICSAKPQHVHGKDMFTARASTKLSMSGHPDSFRDAPLLAKLPKMYRLGDMMMDKLGTNVDKVVKLLEPHCNY